jgi:uncharacterized protein (DUF1501 family)
MKEQNRWNDVTIVMALVVGAKLHLGADHGRGGNYFVLGGDVNGC